jgi:hypothetical protein
LNRFYCWENIYYTIVNSHKFMINSEIVPLYFCVQWNEPKTGTEPYFLFFNARFREVRKAWKSRLSIKQERDVIYINLLVFVYKTEPKIGTEPNFFFLPNRNEKYNGSDPWNITKSHIFLQNHKSVIPSLRDKSNLVSREILHRALHRTTK